MNAGHNPPLLVREDGTVEKLSDGGLVLGMFENIVYDGGRVEMRRGDTLLIYSDGVTETWDPDGEEFGEESLLAARGARAAGSPPRSSRTASSGRSSGSRPAPGPPTTAPSWCSSVTEDRP